MKNLYIDLDNQTSVLVVARKNELYQVLIDAEDVEKVRPSSWHISSNGYVRDSNHRPIAVAILGQRPTNYVYHHKNSNRLDNRKANLQLMTDAANKSIREGKSKRPTNLQGIFNTGNRWRTRKVDGIKMTCTPNQLRAVIQRVKFLKSRGMNCEEAIETLNIKASNSAIEKLNEIT